MDKRRFFWVVLFFVLLINAPSAFARSKYQNIHINNNSSALIPLGSGVNVVIVNENQNISYKLSEYGGIIGEGYIDMDGKMIEELNVGDSTIILRKLPSSKISAQYPTDLVRKKKEPPTVNVYVK